MPACETSIKRPDLFLACCVSNMAGAGVALAGALLEVALPPEGQLAMAWEANPVIRQQMRDDGRLLQWPNKATTGVASQPALVMNRTAIQVALTEWATVCGEPKSLPIDWVREEVHVGVHRSSRL